MLAVVTVTAAIRRSTTAVSRGALQELRKEGKKFRIAEVC